MTETSGHKKKLMHILVAEDSENDAFIIQDSFRRANLKNVLTIVRDGQEAINYLKKQPPYEEAPKPSIVLLDINMPKKTGFEVLEEIKKDPLLKSLPVIMLTSSSCDEDIVKSYSGGACTFITKPVNLKDFNEVITKFNLYWEDVATFPDGKS